MPTEVRWFLAKYVLLNAMWAGRLSPGVKWRGLMPGAEAFVLTLIVIAGLLLFARLRRARLGGEAAEPPPFVLGIYRGCAFVIIVFAAFAWGSIVLGWIINPQR